MKMRDRLIIASLSVAVVATPALAWPEDRTVTREVFGDNLAIRMADGSIARGRLSIQVSATLSIQEDGNGNWPDDRSCHFRGVRRTLVRSLTLTTADGTEIPVRDTVIALPPGNEKHWGKVTPCNDKAGEAEGYLDGEIGSASTWQSYIDGQRATSLKIIRQFGQVLNR